MSDQPGGHVCVLRNKGGGGWIVSICQRQGNRTVLREFDTREEAAEFALAERDRLRQIDGHEPTIEMPDDCPCYPTD